MSDDPKKLEYQFPFVDYWPRASGVQQQTALDFRATFSEADSKLRAEVVALRQDVEYLKAEVQELRLGNRRY